MATCAFDLAFKLGCRPVVFVGQDMAYTGGVTHADGTNHSALGTRGFLSAPAADAPDDYRDYARDDLFGRRARTNAKMETWRRWFELVIAHDNLSALNATEGGLPIEGAPGVSLDEAIARHARSKSLPSLAARLTRRAAPDTRPLREGLAAARAEALAVASACRRALPELKSALAGGLDSARAASRLDRLAALAGEITRRELFYRLTRWSVDAALDEVEELKLAARGQGEAAQRAASLKGYQTLFARLHELAAGFEEKLAAAEAALAGELKAAS
ncbi:MAG: motility associated factor glycosyltransferase family protein [Nitrospinae bacterium]|nr:motility associated factor glycosyltransferase family protein [Nitrospinota bacterium]